MESEKSGARLVNYLKKKRLLIHKKEADFYQLDFTEYGEPVLMTISGSDESSLIVKLLYTDAIKLYRATLLGSFICGSMVIDDIKVLNQPSYSPRFKKPFGKGYGTLLMKSALLEAKKRGATTVIGNMVTFDEEHKKRQTNYYSKFGFTIDSRDKLFKKI